MKRKLVFLNVFDALEFITSRPNVAKGNQDTAAKTENDYRLEYGDRLQWVGGMTYKQYAEYLRRGQWAEEAMKIQICAEQIQADLPLMDAPTRRRKMRFKGKRVNTGAYLAGKPECWEGRQQDEKIGDAPIITCVFSSGFSWTMNEDAIFWNTAAMLAFAHHMEIRGGRHVEIWSAWMCEHLFRDRPHNAAIMVKLKAADHQYDLNDLAATCSPSYLRNLHFALAERVASVRGNYGYPMSGTSFNAAVRNFFTDDGIDPDPLVLSGSGLHGEGLPRNLNDAIRWVEKEVNALRVMLEPEF